MHLFIVVIEERASAKMNHRKVKLGQPTKGLGEDCGAGSLGLQGITVPGSQGNRAEVARASGPPSWSAGSLAPVVVTEERGWSGDGRASSLSRRDGGKSPAEKCHLQPDTEARAFTNLPVTMTA